MSAKFRKVEPLYIEDFCTDDPFAEVGGPPHYYIWINMENAGVSVKEARALRDWLNMALPKDKR